MYVHGKLLTCFLGNLTHFQAEERNQRKWPGRSGYPPPLDIQPEDTGRALPLLS